MRNRITRAISLLTLLALLTGLLAPVDGLAAASSPRKSSEKSGAASKNRNATGKSTAAKSGTARKGAAQKGAVQKSTARKGAVTKATPKPAATKTAPPRAKATGTRSKSGKPPVAAPAASRTKVSAKATKKSTASATAPRKGGASLRRPAGAARSKAAVVSKSASRNRRGGAAVERNSRKSGRSGRRQAAEAVPALFDPQNPRSLRAEAAVVVDTRTMKVVWSKNPHLQRPVASLTKLMTALVVLDHKVDLGDSITVTMQDVTGAGRSHVRAGNRVAIGDLLRCSLISSDNAASRALARSTGLDRDAFVRAMNARARALELNETRYADPTGLSADNRSTAADQARLIITAADNPIISRITSTPSYTFLCGRRIETLTNTNRLLRSRSDIVGCKTGFISSAGYCLALLIGDRDNPHLTTVVLGAPSNSSRFAETSKLINWALGVVGPTTAVAAPRSGVNGTADSPAWNPPHPR